MNTTIKNNAALRRPRGSTLRTLQERQRRALLNRPSPRISLPPARPPASPATRRRLREKFRAEERLARHRRRVALIALIAFLLAVYCWTR